MTNLICELHRIELIPGKLIQFREQQRRMSPTCSQCEQEKVAKREAEEANARAALQAEETRRRDEEWRRRQVAAGINARFGSASMETVIAETKEQREVRDGLQRFIRTWGTDPTNLILLGPVGPGKTFAAAALVNAWLNANRTACFTTANDLMRTIRAAWKSKQDTESSVIAWFAKVHLLVIDEIVQQTGLPNGPDLTGDVINMRYERQLPTVIVGNLTVDEFTKTLGERAMSRILDHGKVLVFDWPSRRGTPLSVVPHRTST